MMTRRGILGLIGGLALAPLAKVLPKTEDELLNPSKNNLDERVEPYFGDDGNFRGLNVYNPEPGYSYSWDRIHPDTVARLHKAENAYLGALLRDGMKDMV